MAFGKSVNQTFPSGPAVRLWMSAFVRSPASLQKVYWPTGSAGANAALASANRAVAAKMMP